MSAAELTVKMAQRRSDYRRLVGEDRYVEIMARLLPAVGKIAEAKGEDPFRFCVAEALRAGREYNEIAVHQLTCAAVEIAEGSSPPRTDPPERTPAQEDLDEAMNEARRLLGETTEGDSDG